jgi:RNA polymerase sigma-70 factor (ECF subfamily)
MRRRSTSTAPGTEERPSDPSPDSSQEREARPAEELIRAALAGDESAFEELVVSHEAAVLRVLRLLGIPRDDRDDVAQDVFIRIFRYLDGFKPGRPFAGWVYRITVNVAHDYRSRTRRRRQDEVEWLPTLDETAGDDPGPDSPDDRLVLRERLERALDVLSERERAVFVLREIEGLSTREVARSLGITGVTVRRHLGRARLTLQRALGASRELASE